VCVSLSLFESMRVSPLQVNRALRIEHMMKRSLYGGLGGEEVRGLGSKLNHTTTTESHAHVAEFFFWLDRPTEPGHSHLLIHIKGQAIGLIIKVSSLISREDLTFGSSIFLAFSPKNLFCFVGS
jgi:hypothetical protein